MRKFSPELQLVIAHSFPLKRSHLINESISSAGDNMTDKMGFCESHHVCAWKDYFNFYISECVRPTELRAWKNNMRKLLSVRSCTALCTDPQTCLLLDFNEWAARSSTVINKKWVHYKFQYCKRTLRYWLLAHFLGGL